MPSSKPGRPALPSTSGGCATSADIYPTILTHRGLAAALDALAARLPIPRRVDVTGPRLPAMLAASIYFRLLRSAHQRRQARPRQHHPGAAAMPRPVLQRAQPRPDASSSAAAVDRGRYHGPFTPITK
jgi:hypothetical protein